VFALRKQGKLREAYESAKHLVASDPEDEWNIKAFGWCLIDLIKLAAKEGNQEKIRFFIEELNALRINPNDEILTKQVEFVNSLADQNKQLAIRARDLSRRGAHEKAADIYRTILGARGHDEEIHTSLAWELYRILKGLLASEHRNVYRMKSHLQEYLQLSVEKPSLVHSLILQLALKLADENAFDFARFVRLWDLENLRPEDFEHSSSNTSDWIGSSDSSKTFPPLAERVILKASKSATKSCDEETCRYLIPYLEHAIGCYPENIWLKLNKARVLVALGDPNQALEPALDVRTGCQIHT
jgi:tetratricopeptide (TPR) repeat protein